MTLPFPLSSGALRLLDRDSVYTEVCRRLAESAGAAMARFPADMHLRVLHAGPGTTCDVRAILQHRELMKRSLTLLCPAPHRSARMPIQRISSMDQRVHLLKTGAEQLLQAAARAHAAPMASSSGASGPPAAPLRFHCVSLVGITDCMTDDEMEAMFGLVSMASQGPWMIAARCRSTSVRQFTDWLSIHTGGKDRRARGELHALASECRSANGWRRLRDRCRSTPFRIRRAGEGWIIAEGFARRAPGAHRR